MTTRIDVDAWVDRYRRAWAAKDDEGIGDLFTPDAAYRSNPLAREYYNPGFGPLQAPPDGWGR